MQILLLQNRMENENGIHFIDSTPVSTCLNQRIYSHKVLHPSLQEENQRKDSFTVSNFKESVLKKAFWNLSFSQVEIAMTAR